MKILFISLLLATSAFVAFRILPVAIPGPEDHLEGLAWRPVFLCGNTNETRINSGTPGGQLFMAQCARCHSPDLTRSSTGPALYQVMDRVPGREWVYRWIRDSQSLIREGDAYALKIWEANGRAKMDPFPNITDAEIEEILKEIEDF